MGPVVVIPKFRTATILIIWSTGICITRTVITLFNVLVAAATVATLYRLGRAAGYGARPATFAAAAYGLTTLAWPYSRTFFRDPLVGLDCS